MLLNQTLGDGQSQARTFSWVIFISLDLAEFLKNEGLVLGSNTYPRVGHRNTNLTPIFSTTDIDSPILGCEFDCIAQQVIKNLLKTHSIGMDKIERYEHELVSYATEKLAAIPGVKLIGTAKERAGVVSFVIEGIHPHDIGTILDQEGIAVRTGHHCAMPLMSFLGVPATVRASFGCYNTEGDVRALVAAVGKAREVFS